MTIDRAKIMQEAWTIARRFARNSETWGQRLSRALKYVWWNAKEAARLVIEAARRAAAKAASVAMPRTADAIREEIWVLECKDSLAASDWQRLDSLRAALRNAA